MQDLDLDLLRCFATVAELRSFTAAGARLGRSQSAVSIRIKKLEEVTGAKLLDRSNQTVTLTDVGASLLPKALGLLEDSERVLAEVRGPSVSGRLRIGLLEYLATHRLTDIMAAMQRRLPGADFQFHVGLSLGLTTAIAKGEIDLAVALHDPAGDASILIATDQLVWVESAERAPMTKRPQLDVCLMRSPCVYRQAALQALSADGLNHREIMVGDSVQSVRSAVKSGLGVTVLGASCLGEGVRQAAGLKSVGTLPSVALGLHGTDSRKQEVAAVLRVVLQDHM